MQACEAANNWMLAKYDAVNARRLRRMVGAGAELRPFPQPIMEASLKAANELYGELSGQERGLQARLRFDGRLPRRRAALVAAQRIRVRHLHGPHARAELALHLSPLRGEANSAERPSGWGCRRRSAPSTAPHPRLRARFAASAAKLSPRLRGEVRSPRLALARIEVLLQARPAIDVVVLAGRQLGGVSA